MNPGPRSTRAPEVEQAVAEAAKWVSANRMLDDDAHLEEALDALERVLETQP